MSELITEVVWPRTREPEALLAMDDFAAFYAEHWSDVAGFTAALAGSRALGEDLAQEAFTRLCTRWPVVREPRPYVFRIARNLAVGHHRSRRETPTDTPPETAVVPGVDAGVLDAVRQLPERLRVVVLLHYYADLPLAEVATTVRRPLGTVKRQLNEARAELARTLGDDRG